jgi:hypothetical protein
VFAVFPPVPPSRTKRGSLTLVFDVHENSKHFNARLPLGLVAQAERFLPRQIRQALEVTEIDLDQLVDLVNNVDQSMFGQTLIDIHDDEDDDRHITVHVE